MITKITYETLQGKFSEEFDNEDKSIKFLQKLRKIHEVEHRNYIKRYGVKAEDVGKEKLYVISIPKESRPFLKVKIEYTCKMKNY